MPRKLSAQQPQSPTVVVAGGAGFLGSHICESLLKSGVKVLALDDLITGSMANLAAIKQHPNFEFIECNINQGIPPAVQEKHISHIVHAAGVETHGESKDATLAMALTGAFGTKNLLDLAVASGARFLLVSSINVYEGLASSTNLAYYFGSNSEQEARFSQHEAKRYAEGLCELYASDYNLDARVARISQLYGPRMDIRSPELIARLIKLTLSGTDLEVDADGSATLLLTYVADAVYGISRLLFA
jgi:UDP-glucuronate decarboxylase